MRYQGSSEYEANGARDHRIALTPMAADSGPAWNPWLFWLGALVAVSLGLFVR